jgi:nitroreductase
MEELAFIYRRRSVRRFTGDPVPEDHIRELVKAASFAPSGKNAQNWQFVVVPDRAKIEEIAVLVEKKNAELAARFKDKSKAEALRAMVRYQTVFRGAPVLVLVYAGPYDTVGEMLLADGAVTSEEAAYYARPNPGIQNIAAAMENLQLAAASLGYGTCWMTGPTCAAAEITDYIGAANIKPGYFLAAVTPLGVPAPGTGSQPPRRPPEDIMTIIR